MKEKNIDVLRGEFIGKEIIVVNKSIKGKVIDETKNSFLIETKDDLKKRILKQNNNFEFRFSSGNYFVEGNQILMKPEDRIKIKNGNKKYRN